MGKRISAILLAAAMLLGMLPAVSMAAEAESIYHAAYADGITADGSAAETAWVMDNVITDGTNARKFGVLWNKDRLYLAVVPEAADTQVTVKVGDATATVTGEGVTGVEGAESAWGDVVEIVLPMDQLGVSLTAYNQIIFVSLEMGTLTWTGDVALAYAVRSEVLFSANNKGIGSGANDPNMTVALNSDSDGFTMSNKYIAGAANSTSVGRAYAYTFGALLEPMGRDLVTEFNFTAEAMPVYCAADDLSAYDPMYICYGYTMLIKDAEGKAVVLGVTNTDKGLYLCASYGTSGAAFAAFETGKQVGDSFHIRAVRKTDMELELYVDSVLVGTVSDTGGYNSGWGVATSVINCNLRSGNLSADGANDMSVTVDDLRVSFRENNLLSAMLPSAFLGENETVQTVNRKLNLVQTWTNPILDVPVDIEWSSDNEDVIASDGTVSVGSEDIEVVLTAAMKDDPTMTKSFTITVPKKVIHSYFVDNALTVDGAMDEAAWEYAEVRSFAESGGTGAPTGDVRVLMHKGIAYMALNVTEAESMTLQLGEKSWNLDLTQTTLTGDGLTGAVGDGVVELAIDLPALDMQILDYGQTMPLRMSLTGSGLTTALDCDSIYLCFAAKRVNIYNNTYTPTTIPYTGASIRSDYATIGSDCVTIKADGLNAHQNSGYWIQQGAMTMLDQTKNMLLEQTIQVVTMPETEGGYLSSTSLAPHMANGHTILLEITGDTVLYSLTIFNAGNGALQAYVYQADLTAVGPIPLGVQVGDSFRLGTLWKTDRTLTILVNGKVIAVVDDVTTENNNVYRKNTLLHSYYDTTISSTTSAEINFRDIQMTVGSGLDVSTVIPMDPLSEEASAAVLLPGVKLTSLTESITLPEYFDSVYLGRLPLTWESSDESCLALDGTVTMPEGKRPAYTDLSVSVTGGSELWVETVRIPGTESILEQTAPTVLVPFTTETVTVNGTKADSEYWSISNKVLLNGTSVAKYGVQWDLNNLYLAVNTTSNVSLKINENTVDLSGAAKGTVLEAAIALKDLSLDDISDYGEELAVELTAGGGTWTGIWVLTSNDYFMTHMTGSSGAIKSGANAADANHGVQADSANPGTYRFFDMYEAGGTNPAGVRAYLIMQGGNTDPGVYAPMDDRTVATWCEFDFKATSLPEYDNRATNTGAVYFSNYGFNFALGNGRDEYNDSLHIRAGIFNSVNGLGLCVLGNKGEGVTYQELNKQIGDEFRIAVRWEVNGDAVFYIDGSELMTVENAEMMVGSYVNNGLVMNTLRSNDAPTSAYDNIDVTVSNITLGKSYGDVNLDAVTLQTLLAENEDPYQVALDLDMPKTLTNPQTGWESTLTWTTSHADVVDLDGKVTQPEGRGVLVTLTVTDGTNTKTFDVYVSGKGIGVSNDILVVEDDKDTANGAGYFKDVYQFTLDDTNNSVVLDMGSEKTVNVITLTDGDAISRLNESVLDIWVSDDNVTYLRVKSFKILRDGMYTYLYDFEATARYIKVHCTHHDGTDADFVGALEGMVAASYEEVFGANGGEFTGESTVTVTNNDSVIRYDDAWTVSGSAVPAVREDKADVRFYLDGELLYHYYDGENYQVRIPEIGAGASVGLTVLYGNADAMDISNQEYVYEVVYGSREGYVDEIRRWQISLPDGRLVSFQVARDEEWEEMTSTDKWVTARMDHIEYAYSYNGGLTWTEGTKIENSYSGNLTEDGWINALGGIYYDPDVGEQGRIVIHGYYYVKFEASNIDDSFCYMRFMYSDDMGETWNRCEEVDILGEQTKYFLSYTNPIRAGSYDGAGSGVDYVVPAGTQYDNLGRFCCRVLYTCDAGLTWSMSESRLMMEGQGIHAMEGGLSEATIMEIPNQPGKMILYVRCQYDSVNTFARAYSDDYGKTWYGVELSDVYTVNTQPIMIEYGDDILLFWGGNNVLGGNSYKRWPMSVGVANADVSRFENIQDMYLRYSFQNMAEGEKITNPLMNYQGDTLTVSWWGSTGSPVMRVYDFTEWLYRTKGAYDSFENSTPRYEGWSTYSGRVVASEDEASEGNRSMLVDSGASVSRSIPYIQDGVITMELLFEESKPSFTLELESAYSDEYGEAAPVGLRVEKGVVTFLGQTSTSGLSFHTGWNTVEFRLNLSSGTPTVELSINGSTESMPVNTNAGDYVCYVDINNFSTSGCYVDTFQVTDTMPNTVPEEPKSPADLVEELIDAIGTVTLDSEEDIVAARAAYEYLIREQQVLVENLEVLEQAERVLDQLKNLKVEIKFNSISLKGNVGLNYYMTLTPEALSDPDAYMLFTMADGDAVKVSIADAEEQVVDGVTYYVFSCQVAAKEMTDIVQAQFFYCKDKSTAVNNFSVRAYADQIMADNTGAYEDVKPLVEAMLQYGAYAQLHFGYHTDYLANEDLTPIDLTGVTAKTLESFSGSGSGTADAVYYSNSLLLKSETSLRFFFQVADGETLSVTHDGKTLTNKLRNGLTYVAVENISAKDLDKVHTLSVNGETHITASALTYAYNVLSARDGTYADDLENLVKALYLYNQAANAYFQE